ncbi:MAG: beta-ketoacyl-ACP synthase 3 [Pirellulaceae bacterium]|nr:beta-ketoacyl-ACP synthase 3 [Pirellulaceae bacterium]
MGRNNFSSCVATGRFVPEDCSYNADVEQACGLDAGWIERRTGIFRRPIAKPEQAVSDLAIAAGKRAMMNWEESRPEGAGASRASVGMLILATSTPDHLLPPTAPYVASQLRLGTIPAFDIAVACSGFLYALQLADDYCRLHERAVLVIAANLLSRRVGPKDPATAAIFSDGAGAVVISPSSQPGVIAIELESDGSGYDHLCIPSGGSRSPIQEDTYQKGDHLMQIANGMAVYRYAVESMAKLGQRVVNEAGLSIEDLDFWIPHQANRRIIESVQSRLGLPDEKVGVTVDQFANSSAATIPIALDYFREEGKVRSGSLLLLTAAAAGLSCGASLIRWS